MSTIIKASAAAREQPRTFAFDDLGAESRNDVGRAPQSAPRARLDADELQVSPQLLPVVPAVRAIVDGVLAAKAQWLAHWERCALSLATAIAQRVVRRELARTPEVTLALVKEALELAAGTTDVRLHMHPDDLAILGPEVEALTAELVRLGAAHVVADGNITRGGCRVETRYGTIDQQLETQLARIEQELL
jgi:flagellar assembly protein FliH